MKRPAGTIVTFRETVKPDCSYAGIGDVLETSTGRRYEIQSIDGRKMKARVMRLDEALPIEARIIRWTWNARRRAWREGDAGLPFTEGTPE